MCLKFFDVFGFYGFAGCDLIKNAAPDQSRSFHPKTIGRRHYYFGAERRVFLHNSLGDFVIDAHSCLKYTHNKSAID